MRWSAFRWMGAWAGLWLVACGGLSQKDFPTAYIDATCGWQARCGVIRDEGACVRNSRAMHQAALAVSEVSFPYQRPYGGSLRMGRMRFDEDRARQCVDRLRTLSCEGAMNPSSLFFDCSPYVGQRQVGEACLLDEECVGGFHCDGLADPGDVCTARTCVANAAAGEQLASFTHACARGLAPDPERICRPTSGKGGACSDQVLCEVGLFCDSQTRVCRAHGKEGEACVPGKAPCLYHLNCGDDGTCHRLANLDEACTAYSILGPMEGLATWPVTLRCKEDLSCVTGGKDRGVCREPQGEGASCKSPWDCRYPAVCTYVNRELATCQTPGAVGAPCKGTSGCARGAWCDSRTETCAAQAKTPGAACDAFDPSSSCVSGYACEDGRCVPAFGGTCEGSP